jgi:hypothetical protein
MRAAWRDGPAFTSAALDQLKGTRLSACALACNTRADGAIKLTAADGKSGLFTSNGTYLSGDLYFSDPHLSGWIGGRELQSRVRPRNAPLGAAMTMND